MTQYQSALMEYIKTKRQIDLSGKKRVSECKGNSFRKNTSQKKARLSKLSKNLSFYQPSIKDDFRKFQGNQTIKNAKEKISSKLPEFSLTPMQKPEYQKISNAERAAIHNRRLQYSTNIRKKEKFDVFKLRSVLFLQEWWKTMYKIITIQKNFRGHLFREKFMILLEREENVIKNLLKMNMVLKKINNKRLLKELKYFIKDKKVKRVIEKVFENKKRNAIKKWYHLINKQIKLDAKRDNIIKFIGLINRKTKEIIFNKIKKLKRIELVKPANRIKIMRKRKPKKHFKIWKVITSLKKILKLLLLSKQSQRKENLQLIDMSNEEGTKNNIQKEEKVNNGVEVNLNNEINIAEKEIIIQKENTLNNVEENNEQEYSIDFQNCAQPTKITENSEDRKNTNEELEEITNFRNKEDINDNPILTNQITEPYMIHREDNFNHLSEVPINFKTIKIDKLYSKEEEKPTEMYLENPTVFKEYSNDESYSDELMALNKAIEIQIQQQYVKGYNVIEEVNSEDSGNDDSQQKQELILSNESNKANSLPQNEEIENDDFPFSDEKIITQKIIIGQKMENNYIEKSIDLIKSNKIEQSNLCKLNILLLNIQNPLLIRKFKLWKTIRNKKVIIKRIILLKKRNNSLFKKYYIKWKSITKGKELLRGQNKNIQMIHSLIQNRKRKNQQERKYPYYQLLSPRMKAIYNEERNTLMEKIIFKQFIKKTFKTWKLIKTNQKLKENQSKKRTKHHNSILQSTTRNEDTKNAIEGNEVEIRNYSNGARNTNGKRNIENSDKFYYKPKKKMEEIKHNNSFSSSFSIKESSFPFKNKSDMKLEKDIKIQVNKSKNTSKPLQEIREYCASPMKSRNVLSLNFSHSPKTNSILRKNNQNSQNVNQINKDVENDNENSFYKPTLQKAPLVQEFIQNQVKRPTILYSTLNKSKKRGKRPIFHLKKNLNMTYMENLYVNDSSFNNGNNNQTLSSFINNTALITDISRNKIIESEDEDGNNKAKHNIEKENGLIEGIQSMKIVFKK